MTKDSDLLTDNRQCFSLGPFHSIEEADEVQARLLEVSASISERQTEALVEKGYWVFMPPYASLLEANQALLSLQALGLQDIGVIYEGEWKNAISLGYFLRQENALRRKKDLEERGHAPLMRVQRQAEPRYWLDYEQTPGSAFIALDMQNRPNDFMQRSLPCPRQDLFEIQVGATRIPVDDQLRVSSTEEPDNSPPGDDAGTEPGQDTEDLPVAGVTGMPGDSGEVPPANDAEPAAEIIDEAASGQGGEIEADSGSETGTGEG
jgi:hypothetical protein